MTLNKVMAVNFALFRWIDEHAFQHITASVRIERIDKKSASYGVMNKWMKMNE